jgi:DNA-binding response OmpR family regulator
MSNDVQAGLILLVEDNRQIAEMVGEFLERRGYSVDYAADGVSGLHLAVSNSYDVIVLDLMLPGMDGLDVCRKLRKDGKKSTPVLMLTARDTVPDRVRGLDAGADDYLTKPFALEELLARVRALNRRANERADDETLRVGDLTLDLARREARRGDQVIELTAREFGLLEYLMRNAGRVLTRQQITDHVWGYDSGATSNVVEIYICYLRDKIDRGFSRPLIRTVRGVGYTLKE